MIAVAILVGATLVASGLVMVAFGLFTLADSIPVNESDL
jgi:hypothetical protein